MIIYLAALTSVNPELYEAASVDGAGLWRKIWHITLPQMRAVLLVTMILQIIGTAQVFLEPYLFTSGGPANATLTVLLLIYNYAFGNSLGGNYGEATALSLMLAGFLAVFSLVYLRATRSWSTNDRTAAARDGAPDEPPGLVLVSDWRRPQRRVGPRHRADAAARRLLVVVGLGPILWLAKSAITPTQDTITHPMALFPHGLAWSNLREAWIERRRRPLLLEHRRDRVRLLARQIVVATTGGFALSVLRPRYGKVITALLLATLFVPAVVLLVPLYVEIVHPPLIHHSFINSYWAIWLPAGASAFNVILMKRFFDNLPREIFEAARDRRRRAVPTVLSRSCCRCRSRSSASSRSSRARLVEGLPLAAARADGPEQAAALGSAADDPGADGPRRVPRGDVHRLPRPDRRVPDLPALVPARHRARRSAKGDRLMAAIRFEAGVSKVFADGTRAVDALDLRSRRASSWCSSARPVAARRRRCGWWPASRRSATGRS